MRLALAFGLASLGLVGTAAGSVRTYVDLLDAGDAGAPSPAGVVVADIYIVELDHFGNNWTAGGIRAVPQHGAFLRYTLDPNTSSPMLVNPGTSDRFVTCLSKPFARNQNARFTQAAAGVAGRYSPTGPVATATPSELNVAFFASPPPTAGAPSVDGYVCRVAIDVSQINIPGAPFSASAYGAYLLGQQPPGSIPVLLSVGGQPPGVPNDLGTVNADFDLAITGIDWGIFVPEPTPLALFGLAFLVIRRR